MSHDFYSPYPPQMTWGPQSPNSDVLLESQLEQIRSLGRIEAKVEPIPAMQEQVQSNTLRIVRLEDKLDSHIQDCRRPRRSAIEVSKELWPLILLAAQMLFIGFLHLIGQPKAADQITSLGIGASRQQADSAE